MKNKRTIKTMHTIKHHLKKVVALILVMAISITGIDTTAFAGDVEAAEEEAYIVEELTEERTIDSTTYLNYSQVNRHKKV